MQTIGATTLDEYRENIEKDSALERRFQRVLVEPTSCEETLQILRNIAPRYEAHHKVRYTDEALEACVTLTNRYITDRFFPDKAIDVLERGRGRGCICKRRANRTRCAKWRPRWPRPARNAAKRSRQLVYEKAAAARLRELALRSKLDESRAEWQRSLESHPAEIRAEHIAQVITSATGIPIERITTGELGRLRGLKDYLAGPCHRTGCRRGEGGALDPALARRTQRREPPDRRLPLRRPDGRRQDAVGQGSCRNGSSTNGAD
nr:hypothetical protein [Alistipes communis]